MEQIQDIITRARLWCVQRRTLITAFTTALGSLALGFFFQPLGGFDAWFKWVSLTIFIGCSVLTILLSITPEYYERIKYAYSLLPTICHVLKLDSKTVRVTVHHIKNARTQTYEQVTPYYPTKLGQGRRFVFTQGITGQAFRTRRSQAYCIPQGTEIEMDYRARWAFTDDEIGRLTQDRRSFYAYPVGRDGQYAKVVLYFDSSDAGTFTVGRKKELDDVMEKLILPILERIFVTQSSENFV